jgi:hypothetical protein
MAQAGADDNSGGDRLTSSEKKELAELRRRNKQLEMKNDIRSKGIPAVPSQPPGFPSRNYRFR